MEMDTWELVESLNRFELLAEGKFREVDETCWDGLEDCSSEAVFVDKLREKNAQAGTRRRRMAREEGC